MTRMISLQVFLHFGAGHRRTYEKLSSGKSSLERILKNKAGYSATEVACGWAGAIFEVTRLVGQEQGGQSDKIIKNSKV